MALNLLLLLLLGCEEPGSGPNATSQSEVEVNCDIMSYVPILSIVHETQLWAPDPSGELVRRCTMITSPTLWANEIPFVAGGDALDLVSGRGENQANLQVTAFGKNWVSIAGGLTITERNDVYVAGTYTSTGWNSENTAENEYMELHGTFSWCTNLSDPLCPRSANSEALGQQFTLDLPYFESHTGQMTTCRMAYDAASGGLQVDAEIGVWMGQNVGQLWTDACSAGGVIPPQSNYLRFRMNGVDGPGTYDTVVRSTPSGQLPEFTFAYPGTFHPGLYDSVACAFYLAPRAHAFTNVGSNCTVEVQDDPGRIVVDCDDVSDVTPQSTPLKWSMSGPMHFESDCDWVEI